MVETVKQPATCQTVTECVSHRNLNVIEKLVPSPRKKHTEELQMLCQRPVF